MLYLLTRINNVLFTIIHLKLKATALQQQEKIEEIYLHLIKLNERLKAVEAENAALKLQIEECHNH